MRVYMGWDAREMLAYRKAERTLFDTSGIVAEPLNAIALAERGLLRRPVDTRGGTFYDLPSNAPASTEFAVSRFLTPLLCQTGWALFVDADVLFFDDVRQMLEETAGRKAVYVVKHNQPITGTHKMDGQLQTAYARKNWSSVMLFNCDHPANRRLSLQDVNQRPGRDLHGFYWLHDEEIGELSPRWNWLVNVQEKPDPVSIAHFTLGGPWLEGWEPQPYDDLWNAA